MADNNEKTPTRVSDRALEMVMRDVLDGMLELSLETAYSASCAEFEIIEIIPEKSSRQLHRKLDSARKTHPDQADILPFPQLRKAAC
ncbi:MAG: hypothetical protein KDI43_04915 [Gammaproteobacteria bacterium]|nr:hypothetical protein [Gammaproteobacteria bacterium]MCP5443210.1 hypothetical protein [Chromatiaceae bacterium]